MTFTSWMVYACVVGVLITVSGLAAERVAAELRRPLRHLWLAAMLLSMALPLSGPARRLLPQRMAPGTMLPFAITLAPVRIIAEADRSRFDAVAVDRAMVVLWGAASALLLLRLAAGVAMLQRSRRSWKRAHVDGSMVCLSPNDGPALVGLRSMDVVLPEWILSLDAPLRAIVLRHEEEHRTARDPYLLFAAAIAVALLPWNLALWYQARRLRLAIEMDCDARVLRVHPSPERYGLLMLAIAQRRAAAPTVFAPMLSEPTTQLERRIKAMQTTTTRLAKVTLYAGSAVAVGVLALAGSLQSAEVLPAPLLAAVSGPQQANALPIYPELLRRAEIEGSVVIDVQANASGVPDMSTFGVVSSSHDLFTAAVKKAVATWHVTPNGRLHQPFIFLLSNKTGALLGPAGTQAGIRVDGVEAVVVIAPAIDGATPSPAPVAGTPMRFPLGGAARGVAAGTPAPVNDNQTFFEFQVEQPVTPVPGNLGPRYPDSLRVARVEGEVLAQFVVDTSGVADMSTFKVLKSTHALFTEAVRGSLADMAFYPARVGGRAVKQLVQMPFNFSLTKD